MPRNELDTTPQAEATRNVHAGSPSFAPSPTDPTTGPAAWRALAERLDGQRDRARQRKYGETEIHAADLRDYATALRDAAATVERAQRERDARRHVGGILANVAYNLAQITALDDNTRRTLDDLRRQWDAIPTGRARGAGDDPARAGALAILYGNRDRYDTVERYVAALRRGALALHTKGEATATDYGISGNAAHALERIADAFPALAAPAARAVPDGQP